MPHSIFHPLLQSGNATAYYTSRGTSDPGSPYSGFSLCHYTGDSPDHFNACRNELRQQFGIPAQRIIIPRQTHSTNVATLTSLPLTPESIENTDAIVTDLHDIIIGVNTADCVPVVLLDPVAGVYGVAHAGWRGAVNGVVRNTISSMLALGAKADDMQAAMGPSICEECFEVGEEVACQFPQDCITTRPGEKPHVSLQKYTHNTLIECGLQSRNIIPFNPDICTRCHPDIYWSARRMGINSGRVFTFVVIR